MPHPCFEHLDDALAHTDELVFPMFFKANSPQVVTELDEFIDDGEEPEWVEVVQFADAAHAARMPYIRYVVLAAQLQESMPDDPIILPCGVLASRLALRIDGARRVIHRYLPHMPLEHRADIAGALADLFGRPSHWRRIRLYQRQAMDEGLIRMVEEASRKENRAASFRFDFAALADMLTGESTTTSGSLV